ncbi:hypothetical protein [Streptomyces canus]|nr:hypothetical protein [Streptomyces canus]
MRTKDVSVGQTYRCEVPFALPYRRYRPETMGDSWWALSWLRGTYFPLSVTDVDTEARTAVLCHRILSACHRTLTDASLCHRSLITPGQRFGKAGSGAEAWTLGDAQPRGRATSAHS